MNPKTVPAEPNFIQLFIILFFLVSVFIFMMTYKTGVPFVLPGDFYRIYGGRRYYFPLTTGLIFTTILFLLIKFFI